MIIILYYRIVEKILHSRPLVFILTKASVAGVSQFGRGSNSLSMVPY